MQRLCSPDPDENFRSGKRFISNEENQCELPKKRKKRDSIRTHGTRPTHQDAMLFL